MHGDIQIVIDTILLSVLKKLNFDILFELFDWLLFGILRESQFEWHTLSNNIVNLECAWRVHDASKVTKMYFVTPRIACLVPCHSPACLVLPSCLSVRRYESLWCSSVVTDSTTLYILHVVPIGADNMPTDTWSCFRGSVYILKSMLKVVL